MRRIVLAIIILGSFAAGVAYYANSAGRGEFTYLTAPVERGDLVIMVTATGTLNAVVTVQVGSQLSGQIAELLADFNDEVRSGQPIARLDPQTFEATVREAAAELDVARADVVTEAAAVDKASADLAIARNERAVREAQAASARALYEEAVRALERKRALLERTTISQSEFESAQSVRDSAVALLRAAEAQIEVQDATILSARAARQMAEARLESARAEVKRRGAVLDRVQVDLARATIRSPIDGVVIKRAVDRGQTVAASLEAPELFTIAQDLRQMEVHAKIDEADIGRIRVGQRHGFR